MISHIRNLKTITKTKLIGTENKLVVARSVGTWAETSEVGQKVQTSSYKIIKSWACNVQQGDYS